MKTRPRLLILAELALIILVSAHAIAFEGSQGYSSPDMVMDSWARAVRTQDADMFAGSYWDSARQLIVAADGSRASVIGVNAIGENFRHLLDEHHADTTGFWLPIPLRYHDPDGGAPQYIYRDRTYPAINMVQFEERDGRWAIAEQHIFWRNLPAFAPGPAHRIYDANLDGTLGLSEQSAVVEALWLATNGRHPALSPLDQEFDFDNNGHISDTESRRARAVLLRDRLRELPAIYPVFAETYLNTNSAGEVTIHAADACLADFIDSETAIRPQRLTDENARNAVADFDGDGWIGPDEIYAYAEMIIRVLASVPAPPSFSRETDGSTEEIVRWTDGNGDGIVSDTELGDLGFLVFAALSGDPVISAAPLCRFDQDRDFLLSVPEQDALRAYFSIELLPQTVAKFSDTYRVVSLIDTDSSGELNRIEIASATELISDAESAVGTRVNSPLDRMMDRKPSDGVVDEWEVWSTVGGVLAAASRQWIESRAPDPDAIRFEHRVGVVRAETVETRVGAEDVSSIASDILALQRLARSASQANTSSAIVRSLRGGVRQAGTVGSDPSGATELTMPEGSVTDGTVELAASLEPVFPVMYKWYANERIGCAFVMNTAGEAISDVVARVDIPRHVDSPIDGEPLQSIEPGAVQAVSFPALLTESAVLAITEGRTVAATVEVDYTVGDERKTISQTIPLEFYDRNAIVWDDDRKAAAFVTARDDQVLLFSGNLNASMYEEFRTGLSHELQLAMLLFDGLAELGMVYRTDPSSPYVDFSNDSLAVDYLQFPRQTLAYRTGDCDDLSVTYAALLEAAGVPAAFITTPGHIFVGVRLDTTEDEARRTYLFPDDLIYIDGEVWLPVEVTALRGTFLEAWTVAARQWREAVGAGGAQLIAVRTAWQEYAPVGYSGFTIPLSTPDSPRVVERCATELTQFVAREIADREVAFLGRLADEPANHDLRNRLGTLYARYGLMDRAAEQFRLIVETSEFYPALLNLGNTSYLAGEFDEALSFYDRALAVEPESGPAILGVARASLETEDYPRVRTAYDQLKVINPALASEHSYLESRGSGSSRAGSSAGLARAVVWVDEPL